MAAGNCSEPCSRRYGTTWYPTLTNSMPCRVSADWLGSSLTVGAATQVLWACLLCGCNTALCSAEHLTTYNLQGNCHFMLLDVNSFAGATHLPLSPAPTHPPPPSLGHEAS
jgi:hypothetical protein